MDQQPPYYTPQGHQSELPQHAPEQQPPNSQQQQQQLGSTTSSSIPQQPYQDHSQFPHYQSGPYQAPLRHYQYNEYPQQQQPPTSPTQSQSLPCNTQLQPGYQTAQPLFQPQPTSQTLAAAQTSQTRSNIPGQSTPTSIPLNQIAPGGAPARQYINEAIAPYLLEGMKMLVREQPPDPLRVLGEWLIEKHRMMNESEAT